MRADKAAESIRRRIEDYREGRDELNLAEFPLAAISNRFLDGTKTVVFTDEVWDEEKKTHLPRKLTISGSDRYGLPTAKDDDVLLACIQLTSLGEFHSRDVRFSRYELLKLLRWKDETKNYRRLSTSLRRWKGVTVYSDRAFYEHARKSWVNRDFGIFDNLYVYEREEQEGVRAPASSWFVWNEVLFESFQAGYLKRLDWDLYCRLSDPVAKRLYRFLDKRFYRRDELVFDLDDLAFNKVRVSSNYDTAQAKRALLGGIRELEAMWDLRAMEPEDRFRKVARGKWQVVFVRRSKRKSLSVEEPTGLEKELIDRKVGRGVARQLVAKHPEEKIRRMVKLFDWYNAKGEKKGPGFLVASIRDADGYAAPEGVEQPPQRPAQVQRNSRKGLSREIQKEPRVKRPEGREVAFWSFFAGLKKDEQDAFEEEALRETDSTKRSGYWRAKESGGPLFEQYRLIILREHFHRTRAGAAGMASAARSGLDRTQVNP